MNESGTLTFTELFNRLIMEVLFRINSGDLSERQLARLLGLSQPQLHNVLKGKRRLQPVVADRLLQIFGLSIADLLSPVNSSPCERAANVPRKALARETSTRPSTNRNAG